MSAESKSGSWPVETLCSLLELTPRRVQQLTAEVMNSEALAIFISSGGNLPELLELQQKVSERGAKVLAILRDGLDARSAQRPLLERLQKDEGANAVRLYKTICRLGGVASHDTGAFVQKTLAVDGLAARLAFLNKGQAWVVRKIDQVLPDLKDDAAREMLVEMRVSHLDNIAACEALLAGG